jgi:hypothetical protein
MFVAITSLSQSASIHDKRINKNHGIRPILNECKYFLEGV